MTATKAKRPRRAPGAGAIYEDQAQGGYRVMLRLPGGQRRTGRVKGTRADAQAKLNELVAEAHNGLPTAAPGTLAHVIDDWLQVQATKVASGEKDWKTLDNYRWALAPVIAQLGKVPIRDLSPDDVEAMLAELAAGGMSRTSLVRVRSVLGQVLTWALARRRVAWNAAKVAELTATRVPAPGKSLSEEQLDRLWEVSRPYPLQHAFLVTGWQLGLRPGELLGLAWPEVDLEGAVLTVAFRQDRGGANRGGGQIRRVPGAKAGSDRRVAMPAETVEALRAWRHAQREHQVAAGPAWSNPEEVVFTSEIGTLIYPSNMDRRLAIVTQAAGLPGRWSMTDLGRRTSASVLSANEMSLQDIADQFGHANTRMLERHYRKQLRPNDRHIEVWRRFMERHPNLAE